MPASRPRAAESGRRRLSADERRIQIVRAATEVVAARGYANATLTEIADAAGVAKGLLWHYFEDRDDLMRQAVGFLTDVIRTEIVAQLDVTAPVPDVVRQVFGATATLTRTHAAELESIDQIVHQLRTPDGRQRLTFLEYEPTFAEHEALLTRGQADGSVRAGDVRVMAVAYQGLIDAMIGYLQVHPDVEPTGYAEQVAQLFLAGVAAGTGPSGDRS